MTDEHGRIFGKISIVDIFAVLAVIIIAVSVYMRVGSHGAKTITAAYGTQCRYTVVAENQPAYMVDALRKSVGTDVFSEGKKIGTIEKIESVRPTLTPIKQANGKEATVTHPEKNTVQLVIKCNATKAHAGILAEGNRIISKTANIIFETKYTVVPGRITDVENIK